MYFHCVIFDDRQHRFFAVSLKLPLAVISDVFAAELLLRIIIHKLTSFRSDACFGFIDIKRLIAEQNANGILRTAKLALVLSSLLALKACFVEMPQLSSMSFVSGAQSSYRHSLWS